MRTTKLFTVWIAVAAAAVLPAAAQEDYGGAAADWKPSFTPHGFNLQGMRRAGPAVGFKEEHFKWMKEWGFNFVRMPLDYRCWVKDRTSANREIIDEAGLKPLDEGIAFARKHGIVAMICLHRIPGDYCVPHADPEPGNLYTDPDCLRAAVLHWEMLARRYKGVPREELFFNLINEPSSHLGTMEQYEHVCRVLIAAIRKIDPARFIVADGWAGGNIPVPGLYGIPGVGQAGRGYAPGEFSHFGMDTINAPKDDQTPPYPPTWPPKRNRPDGRLGGPRWPDWHGPFTVKDAPAANYELVLSMVSGPVRLAIRADGAEVASVKLKPQPNDSAWTHLGRYRGKGPWRGTPLAPVAFTLAKPAGELSVQVAEGDWAMPRVLVATDADGRTARVEFGMDMKAMKTVAWHRRFAGWDAADPLPALDGATPSGKFADEGMNHIYNINMKRWEEPVAKGVWCVVGEFGCANHTAHADSLRFLESNLRLFKKLGMGWCAWGFTGSRFGILDSGRADVAYENWHGQKLDRQMLELLRRHARPAAAKQRDPLDTTWWDPYVENITDVDTYLRRKFRQDVTDASTGLSQQALKPELARIVAAAKASGESWWITKAKCFAAQVEKMSIDVSPLDWFPAIAVWDRRSRPISGVIRKRAGEVNAKALPAWVRKEWHAGNANGAWNMWQDFDHSVPDWRVILSLGLPGMKARLEKYAVNGDPFYEGLRISMDAMLSGLDRFTKQGQKRLSEVSHSDTKAQRGNKDLRGSATPYATRLAKEIACLERLRGGPPQTAYDAMMFIWLYFIWSEHLDGIQCRSLTELDVFLTPYYDADVAAGRTTEAEFREQLKHFLWQWGSINNYWNQPVGLGGTNKDGTSAFNHVSKIILDVMDECALTTPKFLVKVAPNTPDWAWDKMLDLARRHRSIAFIGEEPAARALKKWFGASDEDCRTMVTRGCYEFDLADSCNRTGCGYMNLLKPVEEMLAEAAGGASFDAFKAEYLRRLAARTARCREIAFEFEKVLSDVNPACCMTLSTEHALRTRRDAFANGCPHGNNTAILSAGFGTTVDALLAVKEIVFEKKEMTLAELGQVMSANWKGHEALRQRMLRSKRKWGNNDPEANALGAEIAETYAKELNGKPNSRGGTFLASGHSARQFIYLGAKTGATPDGRKKGEEISKNMSPTMGMDTEGATALVSTLAASDVMRFPADYPLDMMLHPSVCAGTKGLQVMRSLVEIFHKNGGSVIQFTVFSAEELRDAQAHPEKYENLQVRVCGWNVRWNDMSKTEQDAYIRRAENIQH